MMVEYNLHFYTKWAAANGFGQLNQAQSTGGHGTCSYEKSLSFELLA